jgi:hypothetical protein
MSKVRNVSGGALYVPFLEREVADGETAEVPDVQADGESPIVWNTRQWEPVTDKVAPEKPAKSAGKAAE